MKLASLDDGSRDGHLVRVSADLTRMVSARGVAATLQQAIEQWDRLAPALAALDPCGAGSEPFDPWRALAPLPRAWQWLDGSAFATHGELMQQAYDLPPIPSDPPLMYQGLSHRFAPGHADMPFVDEAHGIDFEAEFAVVVDDVPMGISATEALAHIRLVLLLNDWSLRVLAVPEMKTGFGWVRAKPACSVAPVAVTPDELGEAWRDGRVDLPVLVDYAGHRFGAARGGEMGFGFHELIAHAATTRDLCAGTIIGSGTVSNRDCRTVGSSCIAERRAIEMIDGGAPVTGYMRFGDRIRIAADARGHSPFGVIDQVAVRHLPK
jgi:fumarylacetoacetate (FAA) hydrolase